MVTNGCKTHLLNDFCLHDGIYMMEGEVGGSGAPCEVELDGEVLGRMRLLAWIRDICLWGCVALSQMTDALLDGLLDDLLDDYFDGYLREFIASHRTNCCG